MSDGRPRKIGSHSGARGSDSVYRRLVRAFLSVPLFLKILLANALIVALAGAAAFLMAPGLREGLDAYSITVILAFFVLVVLALGAALNAVVIRLALSPLSFLVATAERVRRGELEARAPQSPLADRATRRLISIFNRMLDSVESAHDRQQELALRVLQSEERERGRIAHELYQGTAQTLAGILVRLRLADRAAEASPGGNDGEIMAEVREEVALALDEIRAMARRLRPPELDELGIGPALDAHIRTLTEGREVNVKVRGRVPEESLHRHAALALFRIAQEAVSNAVLHSGGRTVSVVFSPREAGLLTEIIDDGTGFDVRDLFTGTEPNLGVTGMRERAVYVGGTFSIDSAPGGGTRVRVWVPWSGMSPGSEIDEHLGSVFPEDARTAKAGPVA